jgi:hypothetical protein
MKTKRFTKPPRADCPPHGQAPRSIQNWLLRVGGCNPYREPNYRLVLAQYVLQWSGGEWNDFADDATLAERGGLDFENVGLEVETPDGKVKRGSKLVLLGEHSRKLLRTVIEERQEPRYPNLQGWLLQRWYPGSHPAYGDRETWEKTTLKGRPDIHCLGPFPVYGEYENCSIWVDEEHKGTIALGEGNFVTPDGHPAGLCLKEVPALRVLHKAICVAEDAALDSRSLGASRGARMMARLNEWVKREEDRRAKRKERNHQIMKDHMSPIWGSSLESARLREALAKKAGIRSHVGA